MRKKTGALALGGLLGALALALSLLEAALPPLPGTPPGAKLGLSNIVVMYAAGSLGLPWALALVLVKGGFALLARGITAGLMSFSGGLLSTLAMWLLLRRPGVSLGLAGVCGALAHNGGQLVIAWLITATPVTIYLPMLGVFGVLTGLLTGAVLKLTLPALERLGQRLLP